MICTYEIMTGLYTAVLGFFGAGELAFFICNIVAAGGNTYFLA